MKFVRHGNSGAEKPGVLDRDGKIRDLSSAVPDLNGASLGRESLAKLQQLDIEQLPLVAEGVRLGSCVGNVRNFVAVGLPY